MKKVHTNKMNEIQSYTKKLIEQPKLRISDSNSQINKEKNIIQNTKMLNEYKS